MSSKFVKLTWQGKALYVNPKMVTAITSNGPDGETIVECYGLREHLVEETPEQVMELAGLTSVVTSPILGGKIREYLMHSADSTVPNYDIRLGDTVVIMVDDVEGTYGPLGRRWFKKGETATVLSLGAPGRCLITPSNDSTRWFVSMDLIEAIGC
jgi:hypothetical protein